MNTHRAWVKFPMTDPKTHKNSPQISPTPEADRIKHAKLTGKGVAIGRNLAMDKKELSR